MLLQRDRAAWLPLDYACVLHKRVMGKCPTDHCLA